MRRALGAGLALAALAASAQADSVPSPALAPIRLAPGAAGGLGAWLVVGPYASATFGLKPGGPTEALAADPRSLSESALASPCLAQIPESTEIEPPAWAIASANSGPIDLMAALKRASTAKGATTLRDSDIIAYAAGDLHLERPTKLLLMLGADDGVRVSVDGKVVYAREEARPLRDDDDLVPLDLAAGDHPILIKLHQHDGAWSFRARVVDERLAPPSGAWLTLPGASLADARALAAAMSVVSLDRGVRGAGYHPALTVRFPEGAPLGVPLTVRAQLQLAGEPPIFDVAAGEVPISPGELTVALPPIEGPAVSEVDDRRVSYSVSVAGREVSLRFAPKKSLRETLARADDALSKLDPAAPWLKPDSAESMQYARDRLREMQNRGDADEAALAQEARELSTMTDALARSTDPYAARSGAMRMAWRSPADDRLDEYALYVPPAYRAGAPRRFPLIVVLHGMNGRPMAVLRKFLGTGESGRDADWDERRVGGLPAFDDAFIVAPSGFGNAMYRDLGEDEVLGVVDRVMARFPVDPARVTIAGPSMGGIGAAAIPLRFPGKFAAAEPLCGYHGYFVRRDFAGRPIRPWERFIAEERSNVEWAYNGAHLPLLVVHGTQDRPEINSGVLIDRYEALHFPIEHRHPNLGHDVWTSTWADLKGARWLLKHRRQLHPTRVRFRTARLRSGQSDWVRVTELSQPDQWAQIDAKISSKTRIEVSTSGVAELTLERDPRLIDPRAPTTIAIDGRSIVAPQHGPVALHKEASGWLLGAAQHVGPWKKGNVTGPIRDIFHAPVLFVWGASDPTQARANEETARAWAAIRGGVTVQYPLMSDAEFEARGEPVANDKALFLVGNAASNRVVRALEPRLPITVDGDAIVMSGRRLTGSQLGAAFIRPNPERPDRYVVVVEGTSALGTWRSLSLPDLLPDFVVYDQGVAPSRGQMLLGAGSVLAAGFYANDWSSPTTTDDPLAAIRRPGAKSAYDATPYLP
jgi:hypothetical protein